jgi:RNA polymerase sigma-70 factor (ECF subfamily)
VNTAQLIERCRAGDALAVEALVRAHEQAVYRLALSVLDDPAEADEAAQDSFVAALRALKSYRGEAAFTTWLYAITVNVCRARLRRRRAWGRLMRTLRAALRLGSNPPADPEAVVIQNEADADLWNAIAELDEKHRLPVILRYYQGFSIAEIAQRLGISEGTVHSRLFTARERLRAQLKERAEIMRDEGWEDEG